MTLLNHDRILYAFLDWMDQHRDNPLWIVALFVLLIWGIDFD